MFTNILSEYKTATADYLARLSEAIKGNNGVREVFLAYCAIPDMEQAFKAAGQAAQDAEVDEYEKLNVKRRFLDALAEFIVVKAQTEKVSENMVADWVAARSCSWEIVRFFADEKDNPVFARLFA